MSNFNEELKYYNTDDFLNLYVKGDKNVHEMLSLDDLKHTKTYRQVCYRRCGNLVS